MPYEKQNFTDGEVLTAAQLTRMEDGIVELENQIKALVDGGGTSAGIVDATVEE